MTLEQSATQIPVPTGDANGRWKADLVSGFLVFLIALPLCLAIANASCFPPVAGIITAIMGGLITPWFSNSQLTIKGPAAGLIVIVAGCAMSFGWAPNDSEAQWHAYRCTLAVGVIAGCIQIAMALCRAGVISEFFPTTVVHGMLAAIGIIIISKQAHIVLGVTPTAREPLHLLAEIPHSVMHSLNPAIACIGLTCLATLFIWPRLKLPLLKRVPGPLIVVLLSIALAWAFGIGNAHSYVFGGQEFKVSEAFLVSVPASLVNAITTPDFSQVFTSTGMFWVTMFCLIGSLESILSAKAVDLLDPLKRRTSFDRDLLAVGIANTVAAFAGGLPMISEIVRSRANIDNGGRTKFANLFHGVFLLLFLALLPGLIHQIPLAALAAMLIYTGCRLASPQEFLHMYRLGIDQLVVFVATVVAVLATDLLWGILIGTCTEIGIHAIRGVSVRAMLRPRIEAHRSDTGMVVKAVDSLVFTTWIWLRRQLLAVESPLPVIIDLSDAVVIDHTVLTKLHELKLDWSTSGRTLTVVGLETHGAMSAHPLSCRRKTVKSPVVPLTSG